MTSIHTLTPHFYTRLFNIILPSAPVYPKWMIFKHKTRLLLAG